MRVLVTGWFGFRHGEATAGDVGAARAISAVLGTAGIEHDLAWSPTLRADGPTLPDVRPRDYDHLVFVCGPAHGRQVRDLHERFAHCRRLAVGVSVVDPDDPAVRGFHAVIARDRPCAPARADLAATAPRGPSVPVVGVVAAPGQPEYADRSGHDRVHAELGRWLAARDCARVPMDTRLDTADWRHCATHTQFDALVRRADLVVTTRLHGLVLALRNGVPALAVDPVIGGAKVTAQAAAWSWPVVTPPDRDTPLPRARLDALWSWCLSPTARDLSARASATTADPTPLAQTLLNHLPHPTNPDPQPRHAV